MAQYYSLLTAIGAAQIANAISLGGTVTVTQFAAGTGDGAEYDPTEDQTALKSEVYRGNVNSIDIVTGTPNVIEFHCVIPVTEGGWTLREVGLFDADGNLLVIAKYPSSYKPVQSEGTAGDFSLKIQVGVVNTNVVELKIDPAVVLATKKNVNDALNDHKNDPDAHPHNHDDRYAPKNHSHSLPAHGHTWSEVSEKPQTFPPSDHNHDDRYRKVTEKIQTGDIQDAVVTKEKLAPGLFDLTLKSTRSTAGTWTVTGLVVGKPVFIFFKSLNTQNSSNFYLTVSSGSTYAAQFNTGIPAYYRQAVDEGGSGFANGAFIFLPTSTTMIFEVYLANQAGEMSLFQ
jgi:phage-related tail fiber protein